MKKIQTAPTLSKAEVPESRSMLEAIARAGARSLLEAALRAEVADYIEAHDGDRDDGGHARG